MIRVTVIQKTINQQLLQQRRQTFSGLSFLNWTFFLQIKSLEAFKHLKTSLQTLGQDLSINWQILCTDAKKKKQEENRGREEKRGEREKRWPTNRLSLNSSPVVQLLFGFWFLFELLLLLLAGLTFDLWILLKLLFFCAPLNRLRNNRGKDQSCDILHFTDVRLPSFCLLKTSVSSWIFFINLIFVIYFWCWLKLKRCSWCSGAE